MARQLRCLFCTGTVFGSPDDPPGVGSVIICGSCAGLHWLGAEPCPDHPLELSPYLRRPSRQERFEMAQRPEVKAFLDAYHADQIDSRLKAVRGKKKLKDIGPGGPTRVQDGQQVRLTLQGPDHPDSR